MQSITTTNIDVCPLLSRGKVRDIYNLDEHSLLIVTTDRMSAFDVIMKEAVPYKGVVLNQITLFWMEKFKDIVSNHLLESDVRHFPAKLSPWADELEGRAVIVRKAEPLPVECIVRGYITGSGWKDYLASGKVCGHTLPANLQESAKLTPALFTPSTKAALGQHDENISRERAAEILGREDALFVEKTSLSLYESAREHAAARGIIVADTKFEFGRIDGKLTLIDEVLTPDSSRFWPAKEYAVGRGQRSFDKQYLRDWLNAQPWNKQPPPPSLPTEVIAETAGKYREAYAILTGKELTLPEN
ncbi:MAG: phosphoribosylaminoimidazolesuccinocarboxamide synthase [Desulfovibrio sp.]|nr:phosphoribosylaminoimidazolesuccinocarboxamide synthase [Desulfovibrio sp.]